jgi:hypothetical protein
MALANSSARGTIRLCSITLTVVALISGIAGCSGADSNSTSPPATTPPSAAHQAGHGGMTGQISGINGTTWTVRSARGKDVTVTITPQTQFGTKKAPATVDKFTVGQTVRVAGQRNNDTITAVRITEAKARPAASTSPPPPASTSTPAATG